MRDLRLELKNWDANTPIDWKPVDGDILVGFVRETAPLDTGKEGDASVIIEEERTCTNILVQIDSPQLSALFELHNPRANDKVGIKYIGYDENGTKRYAMLIDRDIPISPAQIDDEEPNEISEDISDNNIDVTSEERDFIQLMIADDNIEDEKTEEPDEPVEIVETPEIHNINLKGIINRHQDELSRQTKTLEHLEAMILQSMSCNECSSECSHINECDQEVSPEEPQVISKVILNEEPIPQKSNKWLVLLVIILAITIGALFGYLNPIFHWWLR